MILDGSVSIYQSLYLCVADGFQNPLTGSCFGCPTYNVASRSSATTMIVAVQIAVIPSVAALHDHNDFTILCSPDELKLHLRLTVFGQGCLSTLSTIIQYAICGNVHHLDITRLCIIGHLPEIAAVSIVNVSPHGFALEGSVHCLGGMCGSLFIDGLVVLIVFTSCYALCIGPLQRADNAVVAISNGKLDDRSHNGSIACLNLLDDFVYLLDSNIGDIILKDFESQLHVIDESVVIFIAAVVLANLCTTKFVNGVVAIARQIILIGAKTAVEAILCKGEVIYT